MTRIRGVCPICGSTMYIRFGERKYGDRLAWSFSEYCGHCGHAEEVDRYDSLPYVTRLITQRQEDEWQLRIVSLGAQPVMGLKALRGVLRPTMRELVHLKCQLPGVVAKGTKTEMQVLSDRLIEGCPDIEVEIVRVGKK